MTATPVDNRGNTNSGLSPNSQQEPLLYDIRGQSFFKNPLEWFDRRVEDALADRSYTADVLAEKHNFNKKKWVAGVAVALVAAIIVALVAIPVLLKVVLILALIAAATPCVAKAVFHHKVEMGFQPKPHAE